MAEEIDAASPAAGDWDGAYAAGATPWDIGRPQPAFQRLAQEGCLAGRVLDVGCGTGEHALLAAAHGAEVTGVDIAPAAIARAAEKARARGLAVTFTIADATALPDLGSFDVVIDSGVFHVFDDATRPAYVKSLAAVTHPGSMLYLQCFSDRMPGDWGPRRVRQEELREAFAEGWRIERIEPASFELAPGTPVPEAASWLATIRRL